MSVAPQAPLSMGFSRKKYWRGLPFPPPGDLPNPGIELGLPHCRHILYHLSQQGSHKYPPIDGIFYCWHPESVTGSSGQPSLCSNLRLERDFRAISGIYALFMTNSKSTWVPFCSYNTDKIANCPDFSFLCYTRLKSLERLPLSLHPHLTVFL